MEKAPLASSSLIPAGVIFAMADPAVTIDNLRARQQELDDENVALVNAADERGEDLSDEDLEKIQANKADIDRIGRQIAAREAVKPQGQGRKSTHEATGTGTGARATIPATVKPNAGTGGFRNIGEFAQAVKASALGDSGARQKIAAAATTYSSETVGEDGGFAVPPDFRRDIVTKVMGEETLLSRTDGMTVAGNSVTIPKDETTPWQTTGGVLAYWESEAGVISQSKVALEQVNLRLNKLTALVPVSDELMEDAGSLDGYLRRKAPEKMNAKINTAIIAGTGVGQPLGILNSPALVTVAKETSQAADTIYFENIVKMSARFYGTDPVWLINRNVIPQLMGMKFDRSATSPVPVWLPANGLAGQRFSTLMGHPVVPVEACPTLGDAGDIILADMKAYLTVTKGGGVRADTSIHLFFDQAVTAFRFIFRVAGQPWWSSTISPQNGLSTLSPFVALAERT